MTNFWWDDEQWPFTCENQGKPSEKRTVNVTAVYIVMVQPLFKPNLQFWALSTVMFFHLCALICASLCGVYRPSRWALLLLSGSLPQRDAPPCWPVYQNQRRVGDSTRVTAAEQASREWAVWGGLDGYGSIHLWTEETWKGAHWAIR